MSPLSELLTTSMAWLREHGGELMLYTHIILAALFPIYTGAHSSLSQPSSAAKSEQTDEDEEEAIQMMEGLSASDAVVFPVTAGLVLATLYWLIKRYGADIINVILAWYFAGTSIFSVAKLFSDGAELCLSFIFPRYFAVAGQLYEVKEREVVTSKGQDSSRVSPLPGFLGRLPLSKVMWTVRSALKQKYTLEAYVKALLDAKSDFTVLDVTGLLVGIAAVAYNSFVAKPWWLTNVQGFAVSYFALQLISPTSFDIGSLVLCGLFFYDIWAVFFTPLMVTVATKLDQPIKLLFPRPDADTAKRAYSMLGLGDIVLPGLMVGLALRFDLFMFYSRQQAKSANGDATKVPYTPVRGQWGSRFWTRGLPKTSLPATLRNAAFPKPYFTASIIGYTSGMVATLAVMSTFQHAQPALLYLVPAVLSSVWGTAAVRGELRAMWLYSEELSGEALADVVKNDSAKNTQGNVDKSWYETIRDALFGSNLGKSGSNDDQAKGDADVKKQKPAEHVTAAAEQPDTVFSMTIKRRLNTIKQVGTAAQSSEDISKHT
ncbi:hypothetical protein AMS68_000076 [Peltaster fructicola]|uniref:Uncharacterized protein n=1 Tax=Peltaster fructicola TaxID=286661 RepID=A0A6H0XIT9_9PEZI|nr:hypothetical protein AMS68_000076 [Peltaster fructicola]